jgi:DNA-binding IclR family transcriptional regulator
VAAHFTRAPKAAVGELLDTLVAVGQARQVDEKRYTV